MLICHSKRAGDDSLKNLKIEMKKDDADSEIDKEDQLNKEVNIYLCFFFISNRTKLNRSSSGPRISRYRGSQRGGEWGSNGTTNWGEGRRQWKC